MVLSSSRPQGRSPWCRRSRFCRLAIACAQDRDQVFNGDITIFNVQTGVLDDPFVEGHTVQTLVAGDAVVQHSFPLLRGCSSPPRGVTDLLQGGFDRFDMTGDHQRSPRHLNDFGGAMPLGLWIQSWSKFLPSVPIIYLGGALCRGGLMPKFSLQLLSSHARFAPAFPKAKILVSPQHQGQRRGRDLGEVCKLQMSGFNWYFASSAWCR